MATGRQQRRVLAEIPLPQPKIAGRIRRSYLEALTPRSPSPLLGARNTRRTRSLDLSGGRVCGEKLEEKTPTNTKQLEQLMRSLILVEQRPTAAASLKMIQNNLQQKKANVYRSIPYSRFSSNRDAHCYRKAYPHLLAFRVSCEEQGQVLLRNQDWDKVLEHSLIAWWYTSKLPQWDTADHNALREQCYSILTAHTLSALRHYRPDASRGHELLKRFSMAQLYSRSIIPCIEELQRIIQQADEPTGEKTRQNQLTCQIEPPPVGQGAPGTVSRVVIGVDKSASV